MKFLAILMLAAIAACLYFAAYSPVMAGGIVTSLYDIAAANLGQPAALWLLAAAVVVALLAFSVFLIAGENATLRRKQERSENRIQHLEDENDGMRVDNREMVRKHAMLEGQVEGLRAVLDPANNNRNPDNLPVPIKTLHAAE